MMKKIYKNNRQKLIEKLPQAEYVIVAGNGQMARSRDTAYKFRQDSNVLYFSGINTSNIMILVDVKKGTEYLLYPKLTKIEEIFEGQPNWQEMAESAGIENCLTIAELPRLLGKSKNVYMNIPNRADDFNIYNNPSRSKVYLKIKKLTGHKPKDARPAMAELRAIKQSYEVEQLTKAIEITKNVIKDVVKNVYDSKTEKQIENEITAQFALNNVEHAYLPIVASGRNAATLHYEAKNQKIMNNQPLLFDVGAEVNGYSADISRSYIVGKNDKLVNILIDLNAVQQEVIKIIKPGILWADVHKKSADLIAEIIQKHGIGKKEDVKSLYPHAVGHFVGLDTHDVGDYKKGLKPGMVLSVEPGIYKKDEFGLRVEDEVLITETGAKIL